MCVAWRVIFLTNPSSALSIQLCDSTPALLICYNVSPQDCYIRQGAVSRVAFKTRLPTPNFKTRCILSEYQVEFHLGMVKFPQLTSTPPCNAIKVSDLYSNVTLCFKQHTALWRVLVTCSYWYHWGRYYTSHSSGIIIGHNDQTQWSGIIIKYIGLLLEFD